MPLPLCGATPRRKGSLCGWAGCPSRAAVLPWASDTADPNAQLPAQAETLKMSMRVEIKDVHLPFSQEA